MKEGRSITPPEFVNDNITQASATSSTKTSAVAKGPIFTAEIRSRPSSSLLTHSSDGPTKIQRMAE